MADCPIYVQIITPEKVLFDGKVQLVRLPGALAPFTVLKNHAPIISLLNEGTISVVDENGQELLFPIKDGFVQVKDNRVYACATPK